ncbi:hypothetical protein NKY40_27675 [Sinorhizobium meliloti]|uniref:hypothetical protein n=1 Tax=Rhizobium meliloti TaxID=382 RepID=UPI003D64724F
MFSSRHAHQQINRKRADILTPSGRTAKEMRMKITDKQAREIEVRLAALVMDPATQIRLKVCDKTVKEYTEAMRAGDEFPAINVALVDPQDSEKGFILIDGWHRVLAARKLGLIGFKAIVVEETNADRFRWMAAQGNLKHGLRMTRKEKREVFRAYVKAKEHRTGRGTGIKSAREMSRDLRGFPSVTTLLKWMQQDFPKTYHAMMNSGLEDNTGFVSKDMDQHYAGLAKNALNEWAAAINAVTDREQRQGLLEDLAEAVDAITGGRPLPTVIRDF